MNKGRMFFVLSMLFLSFAWSAKWRGVGAGDSAKKGELTVAGKALHPYLLPAGETIEFAVAGRRELKVSLRFKRSEKQKREVEVRLVVDGQARGRLVKKIKSQAEAHQPISKLYHLNTKIGSGSHKVQVRFLRPKGGLAYVQLFQKRERRVAKKANPFEVDFGIAYDDNILQLSNGDKDTFKAGTKPTKFSIDSVDDLILKGKAKVSQKFGGNYVSLSAKGNVYTKNSVKNYQSYSFLYSRKFSDRVKGGVSASYLPHFYLRNLYDNDTLSYEKAEFTSEKVGVYLKGKVKSGLTMKLAYRFARTDYTNSFNERDTDAHRIGLFVEKKGWEGGFRYEKGDARAKAGTDISYNKWSFLLRHSLHLKGVKLEGSYSFELKDFTTSDNTDASHFNRTDQTHTFTLKAEKKIFSRTKILGSYRWKRKSSNISSSAIGESLGYLNSVVNLALQQKF